MIWRVRRWNSVGSFVCPQNSILIFIILVNRNFIHVNIHVCNKVGEPKSLFFAPYNSFNLRKIVQYHIKTVITTTMFNRFTKIKFLFKMFMAIYRDLMKGHSEYMYFSSKHDMTNEEVKLSRFLCPSSKLYFHFHNFS